MALPHFVVQKVSQADFLQGSLYPFTESYPSHLEEQLGRYMGLVMSSEMSGWVFLKPSQRGKIFREFVYCQRFRCVQNKSLDASETASFWAANIYDASINAGAKWNGEPFQSGPVGADSWEI